MSKENRDINAVNTIHESLIKKTKENLGRDLTPDELKEIELQANFMAGFACAMNMLGNIQKEASGGCY